MPSPSIKVYHSAEYEGPRQQTVQAVMLLLLPVMRTRLQQVGNHIHSMLLAYATQ